MVIIQTCPLSLHHLDGQALMFAAHSRTQRQVEGGQILWLAQSDDFGLFGSVAQLLLRLSSLNILLLLIDGKLVVERPQRLLLFLPFVILIVVVIVQILVLSLRVRIISIPGTLYISPSFWR